MVHAAASRDEAIRRAGQALAEAVQLRDSLSAREAARIAVTPTGPPLAELEARIRAHRLAAAS